MKKDCYVYICGNETAFNRLRQICRRRKLEHRLIGHKLVISYELLITKNNDSESFIVKNCNELKDCFENLYYEEK